MGPIRIAVFARASDGALWRNVWNGTRQLGVGQGAH